MKVTDIQAIALMCQGSVESRVGLKIDHITFDSREVRGGSLFIALPGEHTDGHDYVAEVLASGENAALVATDFAYNQIHSDKLIRVRDPQLALGLLAQAYRSQFNLPIVGITGSNGKTTVKEMLRAVCETRFTQAEVLATSGNLNNQLGLPLTLLQLNIQHKVAIVEMGMNHSGELDYLSQIARPTIATVNNVLHAHLGNFNSLAEIAHAKGEIYHGLDQNGLACVNLDSQFSSGWISDLTKRQIPIYTFGAGSACYLREVSAGVGYYTTPHGPLEIKLQVLGYHNYLNAQSVIALALNLGCSLAQIKQGLESYTGYKGRLEQKTAFNGAMLIDDTYNANPDSVRAALQAIEELPQPHWFILADLKELGEDEIYFHQQIGLACTNAGITKLLTIGALAAHAASHFTGGDKLHFNSNAECVAYCHLHLPEHATLLVKGSNSMRLFEVTAALTKSELII